MRLGAGGGGHGAGEPGFVHRRPGEGGGEGRAPRGRFRAAGREEARDGADDGRGIDPAAEARADGDVAPEADADRVLDVVRGRGVRLLGEGPVPPDLDAAVAQGEGGGRGHEPDPLEEGPVRHPAVAEREEAEKRVGVGAAPSGAGGHEGLQLGGEPEVPPRLVGVVEGLLPEAVPGEEEGPLLRVPDREGEHPVEEREHVGAPAGIALEEDLRVGARAEADPLPLQTRAQLRVVVDLPVEHDGEAARGVRHRLRRRGREIHDGEAPVPEGHRPVREEPLPVRPPVREGPGHRPDCRGIPRSARQAQVPRDAAHELRIPPRDDSWGPSATRKPVPDSTASPAPAKALRHGRTTEGEGRPYRPGREGHRR